MISALDEDDTGDSVYPDLSANSQDTNGSCTSYLGTWPCSYKAKLQPFYYLL